jgi:P27 family predicted phage terminase small subunit
MVDDEIAIATWHRIWTSEAHRWLAPSVDSLTVESICHTTSEIAQLRVLAKTPLLEEPIVSPNGTELGTRLVANPAVNMLRKAQAQLTKELSDLGFNPTARARLGLAEVKRQSKLEELLSRQSRPTQTGASKDDSAVIDAEIIDIAADH